MEKKIIPPTSERPSRKRTRAQMNATHGNDIIPQEEKKDVPEYRDVRPRPIPLRDDEQDLALKVANIDLAYQKQEERAQVPKERSLMSKLGSKIVKQVLDRLTEADGVIFKTVSDSLQRLLDEPNIISQAKDYAHDAPR